MKRILSLMLALLVLAFSSSAVLADDINKGDLSLIDVTLAQPTQAEIDYARSEDFKTMTVLTDNVDGSGDFAGIDWITQSTYATQQKTTKYKTMAITFQIGNYYGGVWHDTFYTPGQPGEERIDKVSITREALVESFARNSGNSNNTREAINDALDTEAYLYVGAWITVYNDRNGNGNVDSGERLDVILEEEQIDSKASFFPAANRADMHSRFQRIPINGGKKPDFYPTPEGSSEWQESYLDNAKTYVGKRGEQITFPVNLYNQGTKAATDYRAVWEGQGKDPKTGWAGTEPFWQAENDTGADPKNHITLDKGEFKTYEITVTVPDNPKKLYFKANVNEKTPDNEQVVDNNTMAILIQPEGVDVAIESPKMLQYSLLRGQSMTVSVPLNSFRLDAGTDPVESEVKWTGAGGEGSKIINLLPLKSLSDFDETEVSFTGVAGGTYEVFGEIMPTTAYDIDLSNNKTKTKIYITIKNPPKTPDVSKEDPSPGTRVNLRD